MSRVETVQHRQAVRAPIELFVDLDRIDLSQRMISRERLQHWIPHRGHMAQLDGIVWHSDDFKLGVAIKPVRRDEFWTEGHFPGRPLLPGVLMIEAGAQLASFLFYIRQARRCIVGFTRIENTVFRGQVRPGDNLILLAREVKYSPRRFISDIQGLVDRRLVFESRVTGMVLNEPAEDQAERAGPDQSGDLGAA